MICYLNWVQACSTIHIMATIWDCRCTCQTDKARDGNWAEGPAQLPHMICQTNRDILKRPQDLRVSPVESGG